MKVYQKSIKDSKEILLTDIEFVPDVIFTFMSPLYVEKEKFLDNLSNQFPSSIIFGCSTSGEIIGSQVHDKTVALTAVKFEKTKLKLVEIELDSVSEDSFKAGRAISAALSADKLKHIMVLSDGLHINGAELVKGLHEDLLPNISITGGLAGDGSDFNTTFLINKNTIKSKTVLGLGFYSESLKVGFGSKGGWDSFGLERMVTKSENNVLYELDGEPALSLYKSFLGEKAKDLPGSGLLFPLSMRDETNQMPVVRTILAVDEEAQSLTFAGNIDQGSYVRLMKANIDRLINGAEESAQISQSKIGSKAELAFLISCVGRRLVLKQMVEEEVEAVNEVLGEGIYTTGFYSYGEIAPFNKFTPCALHNQTMTITTFSE